jgi:hypothetical protein
MNTNGMVNKKIDTRVPLSTLWIVVMVNMLKADILSLFTEYLSRICWQYPDSS